MVLLKIKFTSYINQLKKKKITQEVSKPSQAWFVSTLEMVSAHIPLEIRLSVEIKFQFKDAGVYNGTDPKTEKERPRGPHLSSSIVRQYFPVGRRSRCSDLLSGTFEAMVFAR